MFVETEIKDHVGVLSLNRPGTNAFSQGFLDEIYNNISQLEKNDAVRIIIIESKQKFGFSSGLDLGDLYVKEDINETVENIYNAVHQIFQISQKILNSETVCIAAINGAVIGSAITIIASCDLRIATENSWLWSPDPRYRGLLAEGGVEIMRELVGISRTAILNLTNERINAKAAYEWGLLYKLTSKNKINEEAKVFAKKLSSYAYDSLKMTKKLLNSKLNNQFQGDMFRTFLNPQETKKWLGAYIE